MIGTINIDFKFELLSIQRTVDIFTGIQHDGVSITSENADPHLAYNIQVDLLACCFFKKKFKQCFLAAQASNFYSLRLLTRGPNESGRPVFGLCPIVSVCLYDVLKSTCRRIPSNRSMSLLKLEQKTGAGS